MGAGVTFPSRGLARVRRAIGSLLVAAVGGAGLAAVTVGTSAEPAAATLGIHPICAGDVPPTISFTTADCAWQNGKRGFGFPDVWERAVDLSVTPNEIDLGDAPLTITLDYEALFDFVGNFQTGPQTIPRNPEWPVSIPNPSQTISVRYRNELTGGWGPVGFNYTNAPIKLDRIGTCAESTTATCQYTLKFDPSVTASATVRGLNGDFQIQIPIRHVTEEPGNGSGIAWVPITVHVPNLPPNASFFPSVIGTNTFRFDASPSTDPNLNIATYEWDFGDGTMGTGKVVDHTYAVPGARTVKLTVTDTLGLEDDLSVDISKELKISQITVDPATPTVGDDVTVTVQVRNQGSQTVSPTTASLLDVEPPGNLAAFSGPSPASATVLPGNTADFEFTTTALAAGSTDVLMRANGTAGSSGAVQSSSVFRTFDIVEPGLEVELTADPETPVEEQEATLTASVTNGGATTIGAIAPHGPLSVTPSEGVVVEGPDPANIATLAPDASADLDYTLTFPEAGEYDLQLGVAGTEQGTGETIESPPANLTVTVVSGELVVNDDGDEEDADLEDGRCSTDPEEDVCTLRAAIQESNARQAAGNGAQAITFAIDGAGIPQILLDSPLPDIEGTVAVDGTTQPAGFVYVDGDAGDTLRLVGHGSSLRGLVVNTFGFTEHAAIVLGGTGNHVVTNVRVGTVPDGTETLQAPVTGIRVTGPDSRIGGAGGADTAECDGDCVLIAVGSGGAIDVAAPRTTIVGSFLGVNVSGSQRFMGGGRAAIVVRDGADGAVIGGPTPTPGRGPGNVIVGGADDRPSDGIRIEADDVTVAGNLVGLLPSGASVANVGNGISAQGTDGLTVGGAATGAANVIGGWSDPGSERGVGVLVTDSTAPLIEANRIGTDPSGTAARPNRHGVWLAHTEGAETTGAVVRSNLVSGNTETGILDVGTGTMIVANRVGTDAAGAAAIPNLTGIASINLVGGTRTGDGCGGACNLISGNTEFGLRGSGQGNFIGTDVTGTVAVPNAVGAHLLGTTPIPPIVGDEIPFGGTEDVAATRACTGGCNLVAGNSVAGIAAAHIDLRFGGDVGFSLGEVSPEIRGNVVGRSITGEPLPNQGPGIVVATDATNVRDNWIASNQGPGVLVARTVGGGAPLGVTVRHNAIEANTGLSVDLSATPGALAGDGPTANDFFEDTDTGANGLQNKPMDGKARRIGGTLEVLGNFERPSEDVLETYTIELFAAASCDPLGFGETERPLGTTTDILVTGLWQALIPAGSTPEFVTATITDEDGSTSEPGPCWPVLRAARTSAATAVGATEVAVTSNDEFAVGDLVEIGDGTDHAEQAVVTGFGSLLLDRPLQFAHEADEVVTNLGPAPTAPTAAPIAVTATPTGATGAQVSFAPVPPESDGGSDLTAHTAVCTAAGRPSGWASAGPAATSVTVTGLTAGVAYGCVVHASNAVGDGPDSSPAATVTVGVPGPPRSVANKPGGPKRSIKVTWGVAEANGGPVKKYHVTCAAPGETATGKAKGTATKLTLRKLKKNKAYTCTVRAKNAFGLGARGAAPTATKPKR